MSTDNQPDPKKGDGQKRVVQLGEVPGTTFLAIFDLKRILS